MFFVRGLRNIPKLTQIHSTTKCQIVKRCLRRVPSQILENHTLTAPHKDNASKPETPLILNSPFLAENERGSQHTNQPEVEKDTLPSIETETTVGRKDYVPTFNLAAYVTKSPTLQKFVQMGVDLSRIERRKGLAEFVLRLDFDEQVKPYLLFLHDQGVPADTYGEFITKNPLIFKVDMDDLQTRVNYLAAKKFSTTQTSRILTLNPFWLMFSTHRIDQRLGYFQNEYRLSGDDIRFLASKQPRLVTFNMEQVRKANFCIREEMGFNKDEIKCLLLSKPRLWMMNTDILIERFAYAHEQMQLSHDQLLQFPEVLTSREFRLRQRHDFLKLLGRAQYDAEKDMYISPRAVVEGTDNQFVRNLAKSDMATYELFLKTR